MKVQVVYNDGLYGDFFLIEAKDNSEATSRIKDVFKNMKLNIKKDLIKIIKLQG